MFYDFFVHMRLLNTPTSGPIVMDKALEAAAKLKIIGFSASSTGSLASREAKK